MELRSLIVTIIVFAFLLPVVHGTVENSSTHYLEVRFHVQEKGLGELTGMSIFESGKERARALAPYLFMGVLVCLCTVLILRK